MPGAASAIFCYCVLSPLLTWLNKFVLRVPFCTQSIRGGPFLVTFLQQVSTFCILTLLDCSQLLWSRLNCKQNIADRNKKPFTPSSTSSEIAEHLTPNTQASCASFDQHDNIIKGIAERPAQSFDNILDRIKFVFPAAVAFTIQLTLCNACLRAVPLSSYQATRSSSLIFSILINRFMLYEPVSRKGLIASLVVGTGFFMSVFDSQQITCYMSVGLGLLASLSGILFMSICRRKVEENKLKLTEMVKWTSFTSSILLFPFVIQEYGIFMYNYSLSSSSPSSSSQFVSANENRFLPLLALMVTMILSPMIPLCTTKSLKHITPLGCTIVGFGKSCVQIVIGNWFFNDALSFRSLFGVSLCLLGCCLYSVVGSTKESLIRKK